MIINKKMAEELLSLEHDISILIENSNNLSNLQLESFLRNFEKVRYSVLAEVKIYNKNVKSEYEKIKTIDNGYKAELVDNILKIYVPDIMPSYKNLKTHTHKRILHNIVEITKKYSGQFENEVFIYIKLFDKIMGWDVDNKYVKPISDSLILSGVIQDDVMTKMSYCVKGEYSENPHTEIYVFNSKEINDFLEKYTTLK